MRRAGFTIGGLALFASLTGCSKPVSGTSAAQPSANAADDKVVNLYFWADDLAPDTLSTFEKQTGIKVNVTYFDTLAVNETRLFTGHNGFDVVLNSPPFFRRLIASGAFQPLDKRQLPNLTNLDPVLMAKLAHDDPGNAYGVIFDWGSYGIAINVDRVNEALPNVPLKSWRLLFDPANAAKLARCNINTVDSPVAVVPIVLTYLGRDPNQPTPRDLDDVAEVLQKIRPYIHSIDTVSQIEAIANGDACAVLDSNGDAFQARQRAKEVKNGMNIHYVIPDEGSLIWFDLLAIPKDAPHVANAHKLINYLLNPRVISDVTTTVGLANANLTATPLLDPAVSSDPTVYPSAEHIQRLYAVPEYTPEQTRAITRLWQKFKTGQ
jgi:putrescine transport system substrate-binding protein